jgi:hypothetical protein
MRTIILLAGALLSCGPIEHSEFNSLNDLGQVVAPVGSASTRGKADVMLDFPDPKDLNVHFRHLVELSNAEGFFTRPNKYWAAVRVDATSIQTGDFKRRRERRPPHLLATEH